MWWEPESRYEETLRQDVDRLTSWFEDREHSSESPAWGVGSCWVEEEEALFPFILLDAAKWLPHEPWDRYKEYRRKSEAFRPFRVEREAIPYGVPPIELPLFAMHAYRPVAASGLLATVQDFIADQIHVRGPLVCRRTRKVGTAGITVIDRSSGEVGLLTAAHVFPDGKGSAVDRRTWPRLGEYSPTRHFGTISHHIEPPRQSAGWDVAVIRPDRRRLPWARKVVNCRRRLTREMPVFAVGARSGFVRHAAALKGALKVLGDDRVSWRDCWMIGPGGILRAGDSGAPVFTTADQAFLGLYVGGSRTAGSPLIHYVQAGQSILQNVLTGWNIDF